MSQRIEDVITDLASVTFTSRYAEEMTGKRTSKTAFIDNIVVLFNCRVVFRD